MYHDVGDSYVLNRSEFPTLINVLSDEGYDVIGPTRRDGAIVYDKINSDSDLPTGWTDEQAPGRYGLTRRSDDALFGYAVGPDHWKRYLHPPRQHMWRAVKTEKGLAIEPAPVNPQKRAFLGVRACEIEAIKVQDKAFLNGPYRNEHYAAQRENALLIAVNCGTPASTCFCTSMDTGPEAREGFDIAMTELIGEDQHQFLITAGSDAGAAVMQKLSLTPASQKAVAAAQDVINETIEKISRRLETQGLKDFLQDNPDHPQWDDVADRCLACGNCTSVCPTCFCTTTEELTSLDGDETERVQRWDSCFTADFSELGGGPVRKTTKSRYRQWMIHKLSTWIDQFGVSGCVGCGRCIAWCPVGIDITEETRLMRADEQD
ncbi:MAG: 4Fe-4S dicluster domain-containing protein [Pseudomonadota bacterium]